jgi:hypothetical protein
MLGESPAIGSRSVLRITVGVMEAAGRWLSSLNCRSQGRQGKPCIDLSTERIANHPARPANARELEPGSDNPASGRITALVQPVFSNTTNPHSGEPAGLGPGSQNTDSWPTSAPRA